MKTTDKDVDALAQLIKAIPSSSGFWQDAIDLLNRVHADLPRLQEIERAAGELLAAREAINDIENLMTKPDAPMHRRLNEAWTALRIAVERKEQTEK